MAGRDRSYSPRDRKKSYYTDEDYDYSDSFVSDEESDHRKATTVSRGRKPNKVGHKPPKGRGRGNTRAQSNPPKVDAVVQRVLSAKKLKINELRNQVEELNIALKDVREENKLFKKMQHRQEKALHRFEDRESDLPQIMQRHNNEIKTLREQLRKTRDKYEKNDRYLRDAEDDLDRTKLKLKKYKKLADEENLQERDELARKLKQMELDVEEKESRVKDLEKHITHLNKNHRHEIGIEIARNKEAQRNLERLREDNERIEKILKEKEKELEIKNIYSNRLVAGRRFPNSYSGTPHDTPPPKPRRRAPSLHEITPREKMKIYEEKRRGEEKEKQKIRPKNEDIKPAFQFSEQSKEYNARAKTQGKGNWTKEIKPGTIRRDDSNDKQNDRSNKRSTAISKPNFNIGKGGNKSNYTKDSKPNGYHSNKKTDNYDGDYGSSYHSNKKADSFDRDYGSHDNKSSNYYGNQKNKRDSENFIYGDSGYKKSNKFESDYGSTGYGNHGNTRNTSYNKNFDDDFFGKPQKKSTSYRSPENKLSTNYVKWSHEYQDDNDDKKTQPNKFSFKAKRSYDDRSMESDSLDNDSYSYSDDFTDDEYGNNHNRKPRRSKAQEKARREREDRISKEKDDFLRFEQDEADRRDRELREQHQREERDRLAFEENERKASDEEDWRKSMEQERERKEREQREKEERDRENFRMERERKDREERQWREKQEREKREEEERKNREQREKHERERMERERRDREREEQERRAREEKAKFEEDAQAAEARKKKDLLLAKLKQLDDNPEAKPSAYGVTNTDTSVTKKKEKPDDLFFITSTRDDSASTTSSRRSYKFGKPIENLHHGKPSHEDVSVPYLEKQKKKKEKEDAELIGGYQPSFVGSSEPKSTTKPKATGGIVFNDDFKKPTKKKDNKKSNLMTDLFGNQTTNKNNDLDDDMFSKPNNASSNKRTTTSSFPWEDDSKATTTKFNSTKRENSSTLFGGGSALIEDDFGGSNDTSKLLPKRHRQMNATTFSSRPAVTAVDHYDDDIEEVIL